MTVVETTAAGLVVTDSGSGLIITVDTTVQVLEADSGAGGLTEVLAHEADTTAAHAASAISFTPTGTIAATNVQDAIAEAASEGGGGGGTLVVQEGDVTVSAAATTLDFAAADFDVTESPSGEANIAVASAHTGSTHSSIYTLAAAYADAADAVHVGAADPHPGYVTTAEGAALQSAAEATASAALGAHTGDTTDAHDASAISILDTANDFTATDVEGALAELQADAEADDAALAAHLADTADAHDASAISLLDTGGLYAATDVEGALAEIPELARDTIGTALQAGTGVSKVVDDAANTITLSADPSGYGQVITGGHSYTQLGGGGTASADAAEPTGNFTRRVASVLNAPDVVGWGKSGAQLCSPHGGSAADVNGVSGLGLWLRFLYPNHWYAPRSGSHSGIPTRPASKANPGLYVFDYGYNDVLRLWPANGAGLTGDTFEHHLRTLVARAQAAMVYDSTSGTVTYSGFGTTVNTEDSGHAYLACTGLTWRKSSTNADYFEITLPAEFKGGTVFVTMVAPTNTYCYLLAGIDNAVTTITLKGSILGDLGYKILTAGDIVLIGTEKITLGSTADGGITWTGCTRGGGGGAAAHSASDPVTMPVDQIRVDWAASTAPGASGAADTALAGQGLGCDGVYADAVRKSPGLVTKVFTLTAADAGLKIRGTVEGKAGNEFAGLDSWGIIDPDPPSVILVDQPDMGSSMPGGGIFYTGAVATDLNGRMATVAAEFTACAVADASGVLEARFKATVQTAISSTGTTTLHVTPVDAALCEINDGSVLRVFGNLGTETMLVTAITKTSDTDWSLTVTRGYEASTPNSSITVGQTAMDRAWLSPDWIHPSDYGHMILAGAVLDAVRTITRTSDQSANAGNLTRPRPRLMPDGYYDLVRGYTRNNFAVGAAGRSYSFPLIIDEPALLTAIGVYVVTGAASSQIRVGVRSDGGGLPGKLIGELGTAATTASAATAEVTGLQPLKPGFYWIEIAVQGGAPTLSGHNAGNHFGPAFGGPLPSTTAPGAGPLLNVYRYLTGITSALASAYPGGSTVEGGATFHPWVRLDTPDRD